MTILFSSLRSTSQMEAALKDHQMHSLRLMEKEKVRQKSMREGEEIFISIDDDRELMDNGDMGNIHESTVNFGEVR